MNPAFFHIFNTIFGEIYTLRPNYPQYPDIIRVLNEEVVMKVVAISLSILLGLSVHAQQVLVSGIVTNENANPLHGASIGIKILPDSLPVVQRTTDAEGYFEIGVASNSDILIEISYLSYENYSARLNFDRDTTIVISLMPVAYNIEGVAVTASRRPIEVRNGNVIVNVALVPGSSTETASNIMRKLPGVLVDTYGSITLHGQPVKITMDGKDIPGTDMAALLRAIPASTLGEIELISDKQTSEDASTQSVINIITTRGLTIGYIANIEAQNSIDRNMRMATRYGNLFYMLKTDKILFSNTLLYEGWNSVYNGRAITHFGLSDIEMREFYNGKDRAPGRIMENASLLYNLGREHKLNFNLFILRGGEKRNDEKNQIAENSATTFLNNREVSNNIISAYADYSTRNITLSYGVVHRNYGSNTCYNNEYQDGTTSDMSLTHSIKNISHIVKADYAGWLVQDKLRITAGVKDGYTTIDNSDRYSPALYPNIDLSGRESIVAGYGALTYSVSQKLSFEGGLRAENTHFRYEVSSGDVADRNYWSYIPSAALNYTTGNVYRLSLRLTEVLSRPSYTNLTPGIIYENDREYYRGNPMLNPVRDYRLRLNNYFYGKYYVGILGQYTYDLFEDVKIEHSGGITETVLLNVADLRRITLLTTIPVSTFGRKFYGQINLNYSFGEYINPQNGFELLSKNRDYHSGSVSAYFEYNPAERFTCNISGTYTSQLKDLQRKVENNYYLNLGIRYSMLKDKSLNLSFEVDDLFNTNKYCVVTRYNSAIQTMYHKSNSQQFRLSISFRFGKGRKVEESSGRDPNDIGRFF